MKAQNKEGVLGRGRGGPCAGPPEPGCPGTERWGAAVMGKAAAEAAGRQDQRKQRRDRGDICAVTEG